MRVWLEGADGDGVVRDPPCHVQPPHPSPGKSQVFLDILVWVEYHFIFLPCMHIYNIHIWFSYPKGFNSKWESTSYSNCLHCNYSGVLPWGISWWTWTRQYWTTGSSSGSTTRLRVSPTVFKKKERKDNYT